MLRRSYYYSKCHMIDKCQCLNAGYCDTLGRNMSHGQFRQCQTNAAYRERLVQIKPKNHLFTTESERTKINVRDRGRTSLPCVYRSDNPIEWGACNCHVYDCELHDRCVIGRKKKIKKDV